MDLLVEDGSRVRAVEAKSGATVAGDFLTNLRTLGERLPSEQPHLQAELRLVYGGTGGGVREGVELVPWDRVQEVEW